MSENKWTPGPWHQLKTRIDDVYEYRSCHLDLHGKSELERDANRMLIAAAPDMAEALRRIEEGCSFPEDNVQRACRDVARAALAKARGEE